MKLQVCKGGERKIEDFFFNFIEIELTYHRIQRFKAYNYRSGNTQKIVLSSSLSNSTIFSLLPNKCPINYQSFPILHSTQPLANTNLLFVSLDWHIMDISYYRITEYATFVFGSQFIIIFSRFTHVITGISALLIFMIG